MAYTNISGYGDSLSAIVELTEGLRSLDAFYEVPVNAADTKLQLIARVASSEVVEEPFDDLDIESETQQFGFMISHPVYRTLSNRFDLFLTGEWRRSKDFLLGSGFQFSEGASEDGESKVTVLRLGNDWFHQGRGYALALRNTFSFGLPWLGATDHDGRQADSRFISWLGQAQWAARVPLFLGRYAKIITRADIQLADDELLGLEQFAVGGHSTVRGYRENFLVRDCGAIGSVELRVPLFQKADGTPILEAAPFYDIARSWNKHHASGGKKTISSVGVGALWQILPGLRAEGYWGNNLDDTNGDTEYDLQDSGIHFMIAANYPF
jgi:hemolysin activation/secretion protein